MQSLTQAWIPVVHRRSVEVQGLARICSDAEFDAGLDSCGAQTVCIAAESGTVVQSLMQAWTPVVHRRSVVLQTLARVCGGAEFDAVWTPVAHRRSAVVQTLARVYSGAV
ncbi:hypothetical protein NDU88_008783 [Pleurodeles waltl]|uniref:Uncharacterized protein n=1 Tax=Pleurodeles waltl TaxID=8319 RepID=A0AAV7N8C0_PLEWA|nr:hypothetical protein NDU88_008783 [Pleurodeles waltl]